MKRIPPATVTPETACSWLREQLEALDQYRNASTRDGQFKQWRQGTLTVIQRIWPGVTSRSRRFRRVPFKPPSTLADTRQAREAYERGCAEATQLLRAWITEIEESGIQVEIAEVQQPASDGSAHGVPMRLLDGEAPQETSLPRKKERPPRGRATEPLKRTAKSAVKRPALKDMLGLGHLTAAAGGLDESQRLEGTPDPFAVPPVPPDDVPEPPLIIELVTPGIVPLGAIDAEPPVPSDLVVLEPHPFEGSTRAIPVSAERGPVDLSGWPPMFKEPAAPLDLGKPDEPAPPSEMSSPDRLDIADLEFTMVEDPGPAPPLHAPAPIPGVAEIVALVAEIEHYDVPAEECERVRSVLRELARSIERGEPSWDALRAATVVVMHYPKLGRRAMPVLLPFLGRAA